MAFKVALSRHKGSSCGVVLPPTGNSRARQQSRRGAVVLISPGVRARPRYDLREAPAALAVMDDAALAGTAGPP